jgi:hypothetical protein
VLCDSPEKYGGERWGDLYSSVYDNVFVIKNSNQFDVFGLAVQQAMRRTGNEFRDGFKSIIL